MEIGSIVEGTVTGIASFGAFVELPGGLTGLVHISEIADEFVSDVRDYVREGDTVRVRVVRRNEKGKYDLSLRQAQESRGPRKPGRSRPSSPDFEELLSRFKKDSEERQLDYRRNREARLGGGRRRR